MRCSLTMHLCPNANASEMHGLLHITPLRCSRALALRYMSTLLGVGMSDFVVVLPVADVEGGEGEVQKMHSYSTDLPDLVGGLQPVRLIQPLERPPAMEGKDATTWSKLALALKEVDYAGRVKKVSRKDLYSSLTE